MEEDKDRALFAQLVMSFQAAAWQQLGKIKNPLTDKIERNLDQARYSIDILEMLRNKTKGNLSEDEQKFLTHVISELQLNYVDEFTKAQKEQQSQTQQTGTSSERETGST